MRQDDVQLDLDKMITVFGLMVHAYRAIKNDGVFQELGSDALKVLEAISKSQTNMDVLAFKKYVAAGMSSAEAVEVLIARKQNGRVTLSPDGKLFGKKNGK